MSFPNDKKSIIFFGKSNLELYFSAIPHSFTADSLQVPYSLSPDWVLIGHYIFNWGDAKADMQKSKIVCTYELGDNPKYAVMAERDVQFDSLE